MSGYLKKYFTLIPRAVFEDPFRGGQNKLVVCDTYDSMGNPTESNTRHLASKIFNNPQCKEQEPWFGLEQEYFLMNAETHKPLGWPKNGVPEAQGKYYCGVGQGKVFGRDIVDKHYEYCLNAGIKISGINAEVAPGQWEFQIGPCFGIDEGDEMWIARYLLIRIAEKHNLNICFESKPIHDNWNGSGCHTNFSTIEMREGTENTSGLDHINIAIKRLSKKHNLHMKLYGKRKNKTASFDKFTSGIANRSDVAADLVVTDPDQLLLSELTVTYSKEDDVWTVSGEGLKQPLRGSRQISGPGFILNINGQAAAGDTFHLSPYEGAALSMRFLLDKPQQLAAASGLLTSTPVSSTNTVVTIKKIRRMKTMSIIGDKLISTLSLSAEARFRRMIIKFKILW